MTQPTCAHCNAPITGRKRKYCDKTCSMRAWSVTRKPNTETCTVDGCGKPQRSKLLCSTHYNQTNPNRHRRHTVTCVGCGATTIRSRGAGQTYGPTCSIECRRIITFGLRSELPADHWARWYGKHSRWTAPKTETVPRQFVCSWCGLPHTTTQPHAAYCSRTCKRGARHSRRRALEYGAPGTYTWMQITKLWRSFDRSCAYCHTSTPLSLIQAEHVVPLSRGGHNSLSNLLPACGACNSDKRDLSLQDWNLDRIRRHLPPVTTSWSGGDDRYQHLSSPLATVA